jgi:hypothetical protein
MSKDQIKALKERLSVFSDSKEVCAGLRAHSSSDHEYGYWPNEAAVHIEGLWDLAKELMRYIEENK